MNSFAFRELVTINWLVCRALLAVRSQYGISDDGARIHVISHFIRETVNCCKLVLASSMSRDDSSDSGSNSKEPSAIHNLIQKDRVAAAVHTSLWPNLVLSLL